MKNLKKIISIIGNVLVWIFVVFSVLMTTLALAAQSNADGVPAIGGKCFLTVSSPSMSPTFNRGDLLISTMLTASEKTTLEVGDVISFYADLDGNGTSEINTHRIIAVNRDADGNAYSYTTKGDNPETNQVADSAPVLTRNVIAKWDGKLRIVAVGGFIAFLQRPTGFMIFIVLPLGLLFFYQLFVFIKALLTVKNTGKKQITAADEELIKQRAIEEYLRAQAEKEAAQSAANAPAESDTNGKSDSAE